MKPASGPGAFLAIAAACSAVPGRDVRALRHLGVRTAKARDRLHRNPATAVDARPRSAWAHPTGTGEPTEPARLLRDPVSPVGATALGDQGNSTRRADGYGSARSGWRSGDWHHDPLRWLAPFSGRRTHRRLGVMQETTPDRPGPARSGSPPEARRPSRRGQEYRQRAIIHGSGLPHVHLYIGGRAHRSLAGAYRGRFPRWASPYPAGGA